MNIALLVLRVIVGGLFVGHGSLQRSDGGGDLGRGHDAAGARGLADDGDDLPALRLQHDEVGCGAGFEFVEHAKVALKRRGGLHVELDESAGQLGAYM